MDKIYELRCLINNYVYVGCTAGSLNKRMREHRCLLRANSHKCTKLQYDWKLYGEKAFTINILEELPDATLIVKREAELRWMKVFERSNTLYNLYLVSFRPCDDAIRKGVANAHKERGNRWTPEANQKRRDAQLGKPKGHGAKISATKQAKKR